jgi:hypothetical protein
MLPFPSNIQDQKNNPSKEPVESRVQTIYPSKTSVGFVRLHEIMPQKVEPFKIKIKLYFCIVSLRTRIVQLV